MLDLLRAVGGGGVVLSKAPGANLEEQGVHV